MAWTYGGTPGTSTAAERRDAVRFFVGDTDTGDQQVTDEEIAFALSKTDDEVYAASAIVARSIASSYARLVDTSVEGLSSSFGQRRDAYMKLSVRLDREAKRVGGSLGVPAAGGISIDQMDAVEDNSDRVTPAFRRNQFRNPPDIDDRETWDYD